MSGEIVRGRLHALLGKVRPGAASIVCAPMGSGKTSLLRAFAESQASSLFLDGESIRSSQQMEELLASCPPAAWVVIDDIGRGDVEAIASLIERLSEQKLDTLRLLLADRSPSEFGIASLAASGRAVILGAEDLAFTVEETERLADQGGVSHEPEDVIGLVHSTDGWAVALAWVVRDAVGRQPHLRGAFERWLGYSGHLMLEYVAANSSRESEIRREFEEALRSGKPPPDALLVRFERAGCPVVRSRLGVQWLPMLTRLESACGTRQVTVALPDPLSITLFGRFRCHIGPHDVAFARRRDQSVLIYLALAPFARATRAELQHTFWPGLTAAAASQGLRTTLSRLRRVIGAVCGPNVERYLICETTISLDLRHVHVDARRFTEHARAGLHEDAFGEKARRNRHFLAANRLYTGPLLASEAIDPVFERYVKEYRQMRELLTARSALENPGAQTGPAPPQAAPSQVKRLPSAT